MLECTTYFLATLRKINRFIAMFLHGAKYISLVKNSTFAIYVNLHNTCIEPKKGLFMIITLKVVLDPQKMVAEEIMHACM